MATRNLKGEYLIMMRSLSSAVAGLRAHQTKMDVIGNNISNVNTYGFKASRTTFADVYYQNLSGASSGKASISGGTNPTQIGYGAAIATIDVIMGRAGMTSTDRAMDVYITGDGFLVSKDENGKLLYTRLGILGFDSEGNLIDSNGNLVQGFPTDANGNPQVSADGTINSDSLQSIWVNPEILDKLTGISISANGTITGMLPGDTEVNGLSTNPSWFVNETFSIPATSNYSGPVRFGVSGFCTNAQMSAALGRLGVKNMAMGELAMPEGKWDVKIDSDGKVTLSITKDNTPGQDEEPMTLTGYLKNGKIVLADGNGKVGLTITMDDDVKSADLVALASAAAAEDPTGETKSYTSVVTMELYYQMTVSDKGGNVIKLPETPTKWDTVTTDTLSLGDITIGLDKSKFDGKAFNQNIANARPAESEPIVIGNLVLAKFTNPSGLEQSGTSYFSETSNSGNAIYVMPGLEGTGGLNAGNLEMSNVDISKEFTDMITTQRGFQANTRIITVSDEMLQELVNLKR